MGTPLIPAADITNAKSLVAEAWQLAEEVYSDEDDARAFMENAQPSCLDTLDTEDQFTSPQALIKTYGQAGFDRVRAYLASRNGVAQPALA